jgi:hypothetical protein
MPKKEDDPELEEAIGEPEDGQEEKKEEEKILEPEMTSQIDKKKLTEESQMDDSEEQGKADQVSILRIYAIYPYNI